MQLSTMIKLMFIASLFLAISSFSATCAVTVRNNQLSREVQACSDWVQLSGEWVATYYGTESDGLLGERTGASWNNFDCNMPDVVTELHYGVAMPGAEFYCMPVKVCVQNDCVIVRAVDVPKHHRLHLDGKYYNHVDLWLKPAEELGLIKTGIMTESVRVYVR